MRLTLDIRCQARLLRNMPGQAKRIERRPLVAFMMKIPRVDAGILVRIAARMNGPAGLGTQLDERDGTAGIRIERLREVPRIDHFEALPAAQVMERYFRRGAIIAAGGSRQRMHLRGGRGHQAFSRQQVSCAHPRLPDRTAQYLVQRRHALAREGQAGLQVVREILTDAGQVDDGLDASRCRRAPSPMPESSSSWGDLTGPAEG